MRGVRVLPRYFVYACIKQANSHLQIYHLTISHRFNTREILFKFFYEDKPSSRVLNKNQFFATLIIYCYMAYNKSLPLFLPNFLSIANEFPILL